MNTKHVRVAAAGLEASTGGGGGNGNGVHMDQCCGWNADGYEVGASGAGIHAAGMNRVGRIGWCVHWGVQELLEYLV